MKLFPNFPKKRTPLPEAYQNIYEQHYLENREGKTNTTSLSQKLERWLHKQVAKDLGSKEVSTLEIGAGTLNQLDYEQGIKQYDIIEPFTALFENSPHKTKVRNIYADMSEVPTQSNYDRITSIAVFEHIENLPEVVAKAVLHLKPNGSLRVSIPNEGTIMWKLGTMVTGREFKKRHGLDYQVLMKFEHINTAKEIEEVLSYFFTNLKCSVFGLSKGLAFYRFYECKNPKTDVAEKFLETLV